MLITKSDSPSDAIARIRGAICSAAVDSRCVCGVVRYQKVLTLLEQLPDWEPCGAIPLWAQGPSWAPRHFFQLASGSSGHCSLYGRLLDLPWSILHPRVIRWYLIIGLRVCAWMAHLSLVASRHVGKFATKLFRSFSITSCCIALF